jgi:hypothetical protein
MVIFPQSAHWRRANRWCTRSISIGGMSQTCAHPSLNLVAPASLPPQPEHSVGGSTRSVRLGSGVGSNPLPGCPTCPPGVRSWERTRCDFDCLLDSRHGAGVEAAPMAPPGVGGRVRGGRKRGSSGLPGQAAR